ncbi:class I tRNA ligase family protein [Candidatus Kaiserbacteria bacterium]|nr:class I tRNA ligase family protein [Candidatus Kaiserbacteria bacterium]
MNDKKSDIAKREEKILTFWNDNKIFKKSEEKDAPRGEYIFYDGPPFATGLPHYGHILAGTIKDVIPRYKTMCGFRVKRRWGWDCHGLPLENEIEAELGLKTKRDIEKLGVGTFNAAAHGAVLRFADDWRKIIPRLGRWVNMESDYRTMDATYTESVWWAFGELYKKKLIYKGFKSMHLCPRCGTTLSNFEVNQGYKDTTDISAYVKFPLKDRPDAFLLVWTTTPWTLPGNMAVAVNKDITYAKIQIGRDILILAKNRLSILGGGYKIIEEFKGEKLVGTSYTPPFDYYTSADIKEEENAWKIYHGDFVSTEEGTGIVHIAPAFGEDDLALAQKNDVPIVHHVTTEGVFADTVTDFAGRPVKPKENPQEADIEIIKYLAHKNLLFKKEKITHPYPFCWRCDTPLLNYASLSWFVRVINFKEKLVRQNKRIGWVPKAVGENRFGDWLLHARDWAISRTRFWGAPLPVWVNGKTGKHVIIDSVDELKKYIKRSGNRYSVARHGESEKNVSPVIVTDNPDAPYHITEKGKLEIRDALKQFNGENFDLIITSPVLRARETAEFVAEHLGFNKKDIIVDERIRELEHGTWEGRPLAEFENTFPTDPSRFESGPEGGETWTDVRNRMGEFLYELERIHKGKRILIVSHGDPLALMNALAKGLSKKETVRLWNEVYPRKGEIHELDFTPLPHNENYELDLHRPYIDDIKLVDTHGEKLSRVPDVFDCWFESGSMPYAQHHYPFENTNIFNPKKRFFRRRKGYPADFIAEGMDQTRGWFYSLLVLGVGLFGLSPYRHVIVNGLVLSEDGKKMSKRLKNYPDPMAVVDTYGADALRYYLLSSPVVRGEDLRFSEKGVDEVMKKILVRLSNVHSFYALYAVKEKISYEKSNNVLDKWILARTQSLINDVTDAMERYELDQATRPLSLFVDDFSTWYIRRSRERFKAERKNETLHTTRFVLLTLSKVMAPFIPFYAESLYQAVKDETLPESVHLCDWPSAGKVDERILSDMKLTREVVSFALEARAQAGIKVRQPLSTLTVKNNRLKGNGQLIALIKDEVNVKNVEFSDIQEGKVTLDTHITEELKNEGLMRDIVRQIQQFRKDSGVIPHKHIRLSVIADEMSRKIIMLFEDEIKRATLLSQISFEKTTDGGVINNSRQLTFSLKE